MESSGQGQGGRERRRAKRYKVKFHARWEGQWASREATVIDLSMSGCFVLTDDLVKKGETVRLEMSLPRAGQITVWSTVVHQVEEVGFALYFERFMDVDDRKRLEWLVRAAELRFERGRTK